MTTIYELRINITSGTSYDGVFPKNPINGARTITISHAQANVLTRMIQTNGVGAPPSTFETDCIEFIEEALKGTMRIVVNFDCCDAIHKSHAHQLYEFGRSTAECMNLITASLNAGYHVICSDYSLKALVGSWESYLPGTCPIVLIDAIGGDVQLIQDLEECRKALLPQQKPLADLTVPEKSNPMIGISRINCMADTFMGVVQRTSILEANVEHYKVSVQTIINRSDSDLPYAGVPLPLCPPINMMKKFGMPPKSFISPTPPDEPATTDEPATPYVPATPDEPVDPTNQLSPPNLYVPTTSYEPFDPMNTTTADIKTDLMRIGEYVGYLGQCSVKFSKYPGTLSCSSCHLSNLVETKTDPELVFKCADNMYGRARSDKMRSEYEMIPTELRRSYTDTAVKKMVSSGYSVMG